MNTTLAVRAAKRAADAASDAAEAIQTKTVAEAVELLHEADHHIGRARALLTEEAGS